MSLEERAIQRGWFEGQADGMIKGEAKGMVKGMAKGKTEGKTEGKIIAIEEIMELVNQGLTLEEACKKIRDSI